MAVTDPRITPLQCAEAEEAGGEPLPEGSADFPSCPVGWNCESHVHAQASHRQRRETILIGLE